MITISVVVPTHRGFPTLGDCLTSVIRAVQPVDEIILVADGGVAADLAVAGEFNVQILTTPEQLGPARARNLGARAAQGDILFFVDSDVTIPAGTIERIRTTFSDNPGLAALIGSYDDEPAEKNFLSQYKNLLHHYVHQTSSRTASTFWGACGAVRRDLFIAQGGFDETYRLPSIEDIELGYRMTAAGFQIRLDKDLQVKHLKRWDAPSLIRTDIYFRALPWARLILRDGKLINDLNLNTSSRLSTLLVAASLVFLVWSYKYRPIMFFVAACFALLILFNRSLYRFFMIKRGVIFAMLTVPWHWLYYLYSGAAFFWVAIQHNLGKLRKRIG